MLASVPNPTAKKVVLVGMYAPYLGPTDGAEVWGCNLTYRHQPNLTRLYALDGMETVLLKINPKFVEEADALGIPVLLQVPHEGIKQSTGYPLFNVLKFFFGDKPRPELLHHAYFTSTIAYMLADAIRHGFEEICIHRILVSPKSAEYYCQKPCLDFWAGIALGKGIKLLISEDSNICRPAPWEHGLYGYYHPSHEDANNSVVTGVRAALMCIPEYKAA